jgi:glutamyl/glutaminyl-tRNA synthetase
VSRVTAFLAEHDRLPERDDLDAFLTKTVDAVGDRLKTLTDVEEYAGFAFSDGFPVDAKAKAEVLAKEGARENLEAMAEMAGSIGEFTAGNLETEARALAEKLGVKAGQLFFPARVALTGQKKAPGLFEVMDLLGRERTVKRLRAGAGWFREQPADTGPAAG